MCFSFPKNFLLVSRHQYEKLVLETDPKRRTATFVVCWLTLLLALILSACIVASIFLFNFSVTRKERQPATQQPYNNLPKSLIIGARKCGTRALLDFLDLHPDVSTAREEVHFFDRKENYNLGLSWYNKQMPSNTDGAGQFTLEKSPAYFVTQEAAARVHAMNSSLRLLLILRDPVRRVVSDFAQITQNKLKRGKPLSTLEDYVLDERGQVHAKARMIRTSLYLSHVRRWLRYFAPSQLLAIDGDVLVKRPLEEMRLVETFLGLQPHLTAQNFVFNTSKGFYCYRRALNEVEHCLGEDKGRRYPVVNSITLAKLRDFFQPHDTQLRILLKRNFLWMKYDT